jgi:ATP-dependent protease Clp ATPase subunit
VHDEVGHGGFLRPLRDGNVTVGAIPGLSACWFCGKQQQEVEHLFVGPGVNICSECVDLAVDVLADEGIHLSLVESREDKERSTYWRSRHDLPTCSFCGKREGEVRRLLAGPVIGSVVIRDAICDECVEKCAMGRSIDKS